MVIDLSLLLPEGECHETSSIGSPTCKVSPKASIVLSYNGSYCLLRTCLLGLGFSLGLGLGFESSIEDVIQLGSESSHVKGDEI